MNTALGNSRHKEKNEIELAKPTKKIIKKENNNKSTKLACNIESFKRDGYLSLVIYYVYCNARQWG